MQTTKKRGSTEVYDYAIIGAGLTGLAIGASLSRHTNNLVVIDSSDHPGGLNRPVASLLGNKDNGLRILPALPESEEALEFLEELIGQPLQKQIIESAPVTFEDGGLKPFVGFGNHPPAFYEELAYFAHSSHIELALRPFEWAQILKERTAGDYWPRSYVTKFFWEGDRLTSLSINGAKQIYAEKFIFCGSPRDLKALLPDEALAPRHKQKVAKSTFWTGLCLDLVHSHIVSSSEAMHILNGTTQDEIGPSAGFFSTPQIHQEKEVQSSQWITFINSEDAEDSEIVGASLKKMKRQIKRAYADSLDNLIHERILVAPDLSGQIDLKLNANGSLPLAPNFFVASPQIQSQKNLLGALLQARFISQAFAKNPAFSLHDDNTLC